MPQPLDSPFEELAKLTAAWGALLYAGNHRKANKMVSRIVSLSRQLAAEQLSEEGADGLLARASLVREENPDLALYLAGALADRFPAAALPVLSWLEKNARYVPSQMDARAVLARLKSRARTKPGRASILDEALELQELAELSAAWGAALHAANHRKANKLIGRIVDLAKKLAASHPTEAAALQLIERASATREQNPDLVVFVATALEQSFPQVIRLALEWIVANGRYMPSKMGARAILGRLDKGSGARH